MTRLIAASLLLLSLSTPASWAQDTLLWEGGLWNLDYAPDVSTDGYFRLSLVPYTTYGIDSDVLRVEWIEQMHDEDDRVFASRLVPELDGFFSSGVKGIETGEVPSRVRLENTDGRVIWLIVLEPARFAIRGSVK